MPQSFKTNLNWFERIGKPCEPYLRGSNVVYKNTLTFTKIHWFLLKFCESSIRIWVHHTHFYIFQCGMGWICTKGFRESMGSSLDLLRTAKHGEIKQIFIFFRFLLDTPRLQTISTYFHIFTYIFIKLQLTFLRFV